MTSPPPAHEPPPPFMNDDDDDECLCVWCGGRRGFVYCVQHAARLCLLCDVTAHADEPDHERAPLCRRCHAAPAAAHCTQHKAALCTTCSAGCAAENHHQRPARTFTGCPETDDLARILFSGTPDDDDETPLLFDTCSWVPDLVNIEQISTIWDDHGNDDTIISISELPSSSSERFKEAGGRANLFQEHIVADTAAGLLMADDDLLMNNWPDLDDDLVDQLAAQVSNNPVIGHDVEDAFEASSSLGCYELSSSDAVLQSLTSNNAAACHFTTDTTTNLSFCIADMPPPVLPSSDEFILFGAGLPPGPPQASSSMAYTDQEPPEKPGQDMETRMKQREKRQLAKQRYNDKKKNRRFGKQIMYESRKARADTRNRVKGRFAKSSSNSDQI
ncbi:hypothetical protein QOZ80_2AG0098940 [Eleusine coracana subsp. coracana]|nr:hypothetical protein QOZ80_2AG0098940 [Eleusine coracana subsp. coracana]